MRRLLSTVFIQRVAGNSSLVIRGWVPIDLLGTIVMISLRLEEGC